MIQAIVGGGETPARYRGHRFHIVEQPAPRLGIRNRGKRELLEHAVGERRGPSAATGEKQKDYHTVVCLRWTRDIPDLVRRRVRGEHLVERRMKARGQEQHRKAGRTENNSGHRVRRESHEPDVLSIPGLAWRMPGW